MKRMDGRIRKEGKREGNERNSVAVSRAFLVYLPPFPLPLPVERFLPIFQLSILTSQPILLQPTHPATSLTFQTLLYPIAFESLINLIFTLTL